jgi:hypothetical protein
MILFVLSGILGGAWHYAWIDTTMFALILLPFMSLMASLAAEGRWGKFVRFIRQPLYKEKEI